MKEGQKGIYWLAADNNSAAASAPFVEGLAKRDLEVLFLTDAIDEVAFQNLSKYGEHNLVDVSREQVDLGDSAETTEKVPIPSLPSPPPLALLFAPLAYTTCSWLFAWLWSRRKCSSA